MKNNFGIYKISREEFRSTCELINHHDPNANLSERAINDLADTMDIDKVN